MNHEQLLATVGATVGIAVALLTMGLSRAPGYGALRWLAMIMGTAGVMVGLRSLVQDVDSDAVGRVLTRVDLALAGLLSYGWLRYATTEAHRAPTRLDRALGASVLACAALSLVPSAVIGEHIVRHGDGWDGARYVDAEPTLTGLFAVSILFAVPVLVVARYVRRARQGERGAAARAVAIGGFLLAGAIDAVEGSVVHGWQHVAPIGLLWMIAIMSQQVVARVVEGVRVQAANSGRLEESVAQTSIELASTQATLAQTEAFATLGRLSAAVAHEINNPAAVVAANLSYLRDTMGSGAARQDEELEAIQDTLESIDRIGRIVRQLGEAGEHAVHGGTTTPIGLADLARSAAGSVDVGPGDRIVVDVPESLCAASQEASLKQVLSSLITSALEAAHANGSGRPIVVHGERRGDRAWLRIEDRTPESASARTGRFAPFTAPRPTIVRGDVGLTVSVALLRMFGGTIEVERADDAGSVVCIDLRAVDAPAILSEAPVSGTGQRVRVLIVDDDALTRIGLRRLLGREYNVEEAAGVDEAIDWLQEKQQDVDVIVCDVVMPDGGAEHLLKSLQLFAPELVTATVLLTGGAVDAQTEALVRAHADRVLRKPVDIATLRAMVEKARRRHAQSKSSWKI